MHAKIWLTFTLISITIITSSTTSIHHRPLTQEDLPGDFPHEPRFMFKCWDIFDTDDGCVGEIYANLPSQGYDFNFTIPCCYHILNVAGDLQVSGRHCWPLVLTELRVPLVFADRVQSYCEYVASSVSDSKSDDDSKSGDDSKSEDEKKTLKGKATSGSEKDGKKEKKKKKISKKSCGEKKEGAKKKDDGEKLECKSDSSKDDDSGKK
ncbi:hypothetical protein J5N97_029148 [Dioscorea zingiberensis]|uniref:Prolamin-like domain-containing protein n=1 Tax=Dioscorea zingiberensis TaxID=325984 RepID=A0A9D5BZR1_9LILI|nr:hypothetical protein J5N97_029148 [Dioscorea zingiberensis]